MQVPCGKKSVVESAFNKIAGIHSRSAALLNRTLHEGGFTVNTLGFSALLQIGLNQAP